jgi:Carboxypeptidase regulatory-like domain/TonB dependent receptor
MGVNLIPLRLFSSGEKVRPLPGNASSGREPKPFTHGGVRMHISMRSLPALVCLILVGAAVAWASITGSIAGIVTDPSGAVVPNATVTATNTDTGVKSVVQTDGKGFYSFPDLPVGNYDVEISVAGFKSFRQTRIHIDANSAIRLDAKLEIGVVSEKVTVASDAVHVETQNTQMGEVINSQKITSVPLNGRDFTNLLALQPGVVPSAYASQAPGLNDRTVSGSNDLNAGNQSINGQREAANGFMLNGANVNEGKNNGTAVIPNLDSIEEFRIITNNFDAEYGNYSGGQINVVTKSGTNQIHGDLFEFNRNTAFNGRDFFDQGAIGKFIQNQFGGTVGGPITKDKTFFFADYQGSRSIIGPTQTSSVPSLADRPDTPSNGGNANLLDQFTNLIAQGGTPGVVNSDVLSNPNSWANVLSNRLGYQVVPNEPYFAPNCNNTNPSSATGCVFPNGVIPHSAISPVALGILPFIPLPTDNSTIANNFTTSSQNQRVRDDKGSLRFDANTHWGMLSAYYHADDATNNNPFPNGGANVPGFNALSDSRGQVWVLSDTKSFGSAAVNEFRFSYLRSANHLFSPQGGLGVTLTSLGFPAGGFNTPGGIGPIDPALEGVPTVSFSLSGFTLGVPSDTTRQFNNTFQWQDNYTKIVGRHSFKFGGQFHYDQINDRNFFGENGDFTFDGSETGVDFADFLLGAPASFIQASEQILDSRSKYMGLYAQDSWRVTPNLTFNYGLRWEFSQPWYDTQNKIETLVPGEQSVVFPGAPTGYLVPGDPGIPKTLAPTQYHNFSPRLGLAYSPGMDSGWIAKLTGGPGKTSIRIGYGLFYSSVEDLTQFQEIGDPPYGLFYVSPNSPLLDTPYIDRATGNSEGQRFPFVFPPAGASAKNPDTTFNWAGVEPISGTLLYKPNNVTPYSENYELSLQRQFGNNTVLSVSYVGNQGHKLITEIEANPANQQLCLQLIAAGATPQCGGFSEGNQFTLPLGVNYPSAATTNVELIPQSQCGTSNPGQACVVNTTYTRLGPLFGNNPFEATAAQSSYNSLQASLRHNSTYGNFLFGYTYSKCLDDASGLQEGINPFNPRLSTGLCIFDVTQNFVASYEAHLPFDRAFHATSGWANKIAGGWALSGITTFATGLPVTLSQSGDTSLTGTANTEAPIDLPNLSPGSLFINTNPRSGQPYFNNLPLNQGGIFSSETLGQIGNSRRRFFHGPGLNNWDMALLKNTKITESKTLELRFEAFNVFNHASFSGVGSSGFGTFGSPGFGMISADIQPRLLQAGLKFLF